MLFVFDWDGTLVKDGGSLSNQTTLGIKKIKELGHQIIIATGRHPQEVSSKLIDNKIIDKYVIGANGAIIIDRHTLETIFLSNINKILMKQIINSIKDQGKKINYVKVIQDKQVFRFKNVPDLFNPNIKIENQEVIEEENALVGVEFENKKDLILAAENWKNKYKDLLEVSISAERFLNFNAKNTNKWSAIEWVVNHINHKDHVITFGDSLNDYHMLENSDFSVVVGNSHHKLNKIANLKINHSNDCGILKFANDLEKNPNIIDIK